MLTYSTTKIDIICSGPKYVILRNTLYMTKHIGYTKIILNIHENAMKHERILYDI